MGTNKTPAQGWLRRMASSIWVMAEGHGKVDLFDDPQQWWHAFDGVPDSEGGAQLSPGANVLLVWREVCWEVGWFGHQESPDPIWVATVDQDGVGERSRSWVVRAAAVRLQMGGSAACSRLAAGWCARCLAAVRGSLDFSAHDVGMNGGQY
jgi:hypothetical protein